MLDNYEIISKDRDLLAMKTAQGNTVKIYFCKKYNRDVENLMDVSSCDGDCLEIFYTYCHSAEVWAFVFEDTDADGKYTGNVDAPMRNTLVYGRSSSIFGCDSIADSTGYAKLDWGKQGTYTLSIDTPEDGYVYTCTTGNSKSTSITAGGLTRVEKSNGSDILNVNTKKFHYPDCPSVSDMKEKNKREFSGTRDKAIAQHFSPCARRRP